MKNTDLKKRLEKTLAISIEECSSNMLSIKEIAGNKRYCSIKCYINDEYNYKLIVRSKIYVDAIEEKLTNVKFEVRNEVEDREYTKYDVIVNYETLVKSINILFEQNLDRRLDNR